MQAYLSLTLAGLAAAQVNTPLDFKFINYIAQHNKNYDSLDEFMTRLAIFNEAEEAIKANESDPTSTHTMGHNMFSDWTDEEF